MPEENSHDQHSSQNLASEEGHEPPSASEKLEHLPDTFQDTISFFRAVISPPPHPFQGIVNAEHITKWIEHVEKNEQRAFDDVERLRTHTIWRLIILSALFVFVVTFVGFINQNILIQVLEGLALFAAGVGGGIGLKSYLDRTKR
jgi:hypothetical protein